MRGSRDGSIAGGLPSRRSTRSATIANSATPSDSWMSDSRSLSASSFGSKLVPQTPTVASTASKTTVIQWNQRAVLG